MLCRGGGGNLRFFCHDSDRTGLSWRSVYKMEESRSSVLSCAFFTLTILDFSSEPKLVFVAAERGSGNCFFALVKWW